MISASDILRGKVLIVDDKKVNVLLLERMLRAAGYACVTSTMDPGEVCELHRKNRYDLILLDLQMPGMDGFQVMESLKEIETGGYLPVLVITAQPDHKLRALKAGARDFVSKPFDLAEVLIRVYNMLEVRLLHLETKRLYDRVVAEQKMSGDCCSTCCLMPLLNA
jgi:CheY-like chemotaxis protein